MSSEAERHVAAIEELLAGDRVAKLIEVSLDRAAESFEARVDVPLTACAFRLTAGRYLQHLFRTGLQPARTITRSSACAMAEDLLNVAYRSSDGHDVAYLEGRESADGLSGVLHALLGALKAAERERYERWVLARETSGWDWCVQVEIAELLLRNLAAYLPDELRALKPAQLSCSWLDLLRTHVSTDEGVKRLLSENLAGDVQE